MRARWQALFADLEAQSDALAIAERAAEIEDRVRSEARQLSLQDRLRGQVGAAVRLNCGAAIPVIGRIEHVGRDWLLIDESAGRQAIVLLAAVQSVSGVGRLAAAPGTMSRVESRLGVNHMLRALIRDRAGVRVHLRDGAVLDGTFDRLGADFVELASHPAGELRRRSAVRESVLVRVETLAVIRRDA